MPRYRRKQDLVLISLPLIVEITILVASLIVGVLVTAVSFWLAVDSRLAPIRQAFGVEVDLAPLIPQFIPLLGFAGILTGVRFYAAARRWLVGKLALA